MIDRHLLAGRLASIGDRLTRIRKKLPESPDAFLADLDAQEIVTFNLFLAFQDTLDLASHLIADGGWPVPATYREHFDTLSARGVLTTETARAMSLCAGLRNLIAHTYGSLDMERLFTELPAGLQALEDFRSEVAKRA
jgi:uncharacterized protein YutE (UPF0331/DUF86 family)